MNRKEKDVCVFLSGGGMSSWVWREIITQLNFSSIVMEYRLPENTEQARRTATIADCARHVINSIKRCKCEKVILVAHSGAGVLAANVAKAIPEKIRHVVYIAANIPQNGESTIDSLALPLRILNSLAIKAQVKRASTQATKNEKIIRTRFCNTCSEETINYILEQNLLSEPLCLAFEKSNWDDFPDIDQTYIILTKDKTISVSEQKEMMRHLSIQKSIQIESDHMVMLSHAQGLLEVLNDSID